MGESLVDSFRCDVVAVGRVGVIVERAYNSPADYCQHTVFSFSVERYIKNNQDIAIPVLNVRQEMGTLPWRVGDSAGLGSYINGEAMLVPGKRYLLFLFKNIYRERQQRQRAEKSQIPLTEQSEFFVAMGPGQTVIERGRFLAPQIQWEKRRHGWKFSEGPQLLGLTERDGIALLYEAYRRWQVLDAEFAEKRRKLGEEALRRIREGKANPPKKDPP